MLCYLTVLLWYASDVNVLLDSFILVYRRECGTSPAARLPIPRPDSHAEEITVAPSGAVHYQNRRHPVQTPVRY